MAKYSDIKGFTVQTLSTDTVASQAEGGSWASGGAANTGREGPGSNGTQTSNLVYGGSPPATNKTESYNGTAFTEVADLTTTRYSLGGAGVSNTSAVGFGGYAPGGASAVTETWDGSSWTEVSDLNTARYGIAGAGIITSAIGIAGYTTTIVTNVETWDGSSWTEVAEFNTSRYVVGSTGHDNEAVIIFGGAAPSKVDNVEIWNGSSWTEVAEINSARNSPSGSGTDSLALAYGGRTPSPGATTKTESWDGTSWTEVNDLSTGRANGGGSNYGTSSAALFSLGNREPGLSPAPTEEFTAPSTFNQITEGQLFFNSTTNTFKETISDIPGTSWSSGGSLNEARTGLGSSRNASSNASVSAFGGFNASGAPLVARDETELYNGTAWTEVADMNTARGQVGGAGTSSTSAIVFGGEVYPNPSNQTITETWDGSSWTETAEMNTAGRSFGNTGTQTNAFCVAGTPNPSRSTKCELWNGSAWTEVNDYPTAKNYVTVAGIYTAALGVGGTPSPFTEANTWDGTSWTEITSAGEHSGTGQGFGSPAPVSMIKVDNNSCEFWNGSSWTEINDLSTARQEGGASGATTNGLVCGGSSPTTGATEEFEVNLANKTITAS